MSSWYQHRLSPKKNKFNAQKTVVDGITFDSKKEAAYYQKLKLAKASGELLFFLRQTAFHLPGNTSYRADFVEFWKDGTVKVTDVKGRRTDMYILKKKQVEELYSPVEINEV